MGRYLRHNIIDWFDQNRLRSSTIIVVGAGAVGNEVLKNLALLGVGRLIVCDFDRIEDHNLTRCVLFRERDVGRLKAEAAAEACGSLDPNVRCVARCGDFWDGLSIDEIARADAVICCVDNHEARVRLNELCVIAGTDLVNAGIDSRNVSVEVFPIRSVPGAACLECNLPHSVYDAIRKRYSCGFLKKVAIEERKVPTTTVTSSVAGAMAVAQVLNRINGHPDCPAHSTRLFHDTISGNTTLSSGARSITCRACSSYVGSIERYVANRRCALPRVGGEAASEIVLGEPVVLETRCGRCGREAEIYDSARRTDASVTFCAACNANTIEPRIVSRMSLAEFESTFAGRLVPCKFLSFRVPGTLVIIELED
jgi:molybdopterin/thiamine biosynthesis adenylyltransferase